MGKVRYSAKVRNQRLVSLGFKPRSYGLYLNVQVVSCPLKWPCRTGFVPCECFSLDGAALSLRDMAEPLPGGCHEGFLYCRAVLCFFIYFLRHVFM